MLQIPRAPQRLTLAIERHWDGTPCVESRHRGVVELSADDAGLVVAARLPHQPAPRVPAAPIGARVDGLWEYDVVECFLVGEGGRYLEVELGAGGHFLVLAFTAPRQRSDDWAELRPELDFASDASGWCSRIELPWPVVPAGIRAANAFAIVAGAHLAHHPLPGAAPDFHQPGAFPAAGLA